MWDYDCDLNLSFISRTRDKKWIVNEKENLAKLKVKNTIVRRYQDQELQRFLEVRIEKKNFFVLG